MSRSPGAVSPTSERSPGASTPTATLGVVVGDVSDPRGIDVLITVSREARALGCLVLGAHADQDGQELDATAALLERVDGLVLSFPGCRDDAVALARRARIPVVVVDDPDRRRSDAATGCPVIRAAAAAATALLVDRIRPRLRAL